jgi:hypothetical protein
LERSFDTFYQAIGKGFLEQTNVSALSEHVESSPNMDRTSKSDHPITPIHDHPRSPPPVNLHVTSSSETPRNRPTTEIPTLSLAKVSAQIYRQVYDILDPVQLKYLQVSDMGSYIIIIPRSLWLIIL